MARKFVAKEPKNQRPMIKNAYTDSVKKKMSLCMVPFVIGAIGLVGSMGQGIDDKIMRLTVLVVALVIFLVGFLGFIKLAKELNDYAKLYWAEYDKKQGKSVNPAKQETAAREKITWAQAKAEYKAEAKATAEEASRLMAEKFIKAEQVNKDNKK